MIREVAGAMKHILAVYDVDPVYAARFAEVVNQKEKYRLRWWRSARSSGCGHLRWNIR